MATEAASPVEPTTAKTLAKAISPPSVRNRAAVLAEMDSETAEPEKPAEKPAEPERKAAKEEVESEVEETEDKPDPADEKGLDRIKAAEKRMRMEIGKEREAFERERDAFKAETKQLEAEVNEIKSLASRIKYNPGAVLRALGVSVDDFTDIARLIHGESPEFAKDPKNKEAAAKWAREKEERDRANATAERIERLEKELAAKDQAEKAEKAIGRYLDNAVSTVTDETPLVHRMIAKQPAQLRADLQQIAEVMHAEGGDVSDPLNVIRMLEQVMREEAEEAGYDLSALGKAKSKPAEPEAKKTTTVETPPAKAKPNGVRAARDELVKKLESGDLT